VWKQIPASRAALLPHVSGSGEGRRSQVHREELDEPFGKGRTFDAADWKENGAWRASIARTAVGHAFWRAFFRKLLE